MAENTENIKLNEIDGGDLMHLAGLSLRRPCANESAIYPAAVGVGDPLCGQGY